MSIHLTGLQCVDTNLNVTPMKCTENSWLASEIEVEKTPFDTKESVCFLVAPLTNLEFIGNEMHKIYRDGHLSRGFRILSLNLSGVDVEIIPADDYSKKIDIMHFTRICTVTSSLRVPCNDRVPHAQLELLNNICKLLSLARGTTVSWPYYQILDKDGNVLRRYHRYATMSDYSDLEVIYKGSINDLKTFLESTYQSYLEVPKEYNLSDVIDIIALAKQIHITPELRGSYIVSAVDVLRGRWAKKHKSSYIFEKNSFKKYSGDIKIHILEYLEENFDISKKYLDLVGKKIPELNRPAFRDQLKEMIYSIDANLTEEDADTFGHNRNLLVHEASFASDEDLKELMSIFYFMDSLVLAILNYHGRYVDARTGSFASIRPYQPQTHPKP